MLASVALDAGAAAWAPASAKWVRSWSKNGPLPLRVVWHVAQFCGKPAAVIRIGRFVEIRKVARSAIRRSSGEPVVGVTLGARGGRVGSRQRELCLIVVKNGPLPPAGVVAQRAILWESRRLVIRIGRFVEIRKVARRRNPPEFWRTGCWRDTGRTGRPWGSRQRELRLIVVKRPLAICWCCGIGRNPAGNSCRHVIRIGRFVEIRKVARSAIRRSS